MSAIFVRHFVNVALTNSASVRCERKCLNLALAGSKERVNLKRSREALGTSLPEPEAKLVFTLAFAAVCFSRVHYNNRNTSLLTQNRFTLVCSKNI